MKKLLLSVLLFPMLVMGQENHILKKTYKVETTTAVAPESVDGVDATITFFDGLGRPVQINEVGKSGTGTNIMIPITYDGLGRQIKEYLPIPTSAATLSYNTEGASMVVPAYGGQTAYSEKVYENSALGRVVKQFAPGSSWDKNSGHGINFEYLPNKDSDKVRIFRADAQWNPTAELYNPTLWNDGFYPKNQLYKTITKDENWTSGTINTTEEFKNKNGQVVLKRTYLFVKSVVGKSTIRTLDTYYIYDQYQNLSYVIPPLADTSQPMTDQVLNGLCYQYKYDNRNRLVEKKLPGKHWEFILYDKLDRVIASGPANSPFTNLSGFGWLVTKYDVFNRSVLTGWMAGTITKETRTSLQKARNLQTTNLSETKIAGTNNTTINNIAFRYTNVAWPIAAYHVLTTNYYDNYNFSHVPSSFPTTVMSDNSQPVFYNIAKLPVGKPTGSWTRVVNATTDVYGEEAYVLYDNKSRPIRTFAKNYLGGFVQTDSKIDFAGKTLRTETKHKRINGDAEVVVKEQFEYTPEDRLLSHTHKINSMTPQLLTLNEYNTLGQLKSKKVGGTNISGANYLQKIDYTYNIRGWLKEINDVNANQTISNQGDLFSFKINYDQVENPVGNVKSLYNGNISETYWRTASSNIKRSYGYEYDNLNRLTNAIYLKSDAQTDAYNEALTYDANGNILTLSRNGNYDTAPTTIEIDKLNYTYDSYNVNRLIQVTDLTNSPLGFSDGANNPIEYDYDGHGNMIRDDNKGITSILYNHLNLPTQITFSGTTTRKIQYLYNAVGAKQKKVVTNGTVITSTDYLSGFQYQNNVLEFFPHAEGYVKYTERYYNYVFNYTDHLGNVRLSYAQDPNGFATKVLEENHYYPFGLKHTYYDNGTQRFMRGIGDGDDIPIFIAPDIFGSGSYKYKYNGKELQDELGLNVYDYLFRQYMPDIARFTTVDPMVDFVNYQSPYVFSDNSPIINIDDDGLGILNVMGNLFRRLKNAIVNIACNSCNYHREENISKSWRDPDFNWYDRNEGSARRYAKKDNSGGDGKRPNIGIIKIISAEIKSDNIINMPPSLIDIEAIQQDIADRLNYNKPEQVQSFNLDIPFDRNTSKFSSTFSEQTVEALLKTLIDNSSLEVLILGNASFSGYNKDTPTQVDGKSKKIGDLQLARASAIRKFLISRGIAPNRLSIGAGKIENGSSSSTLQIKSQ